MSTVVHAVFTDFHVTHPNFAALINWAIRLRDTYERMDDFLTVQAGEGDMHCAIYSGPTYELPADDLRIGMSGAEVRALLTVYVEPVRVDPISDAELAEFTLRAPALLQGAA